MWVILSIAAAFCWAVINIIDKYVLTKWVKEPLVPVIILGVVGWLASVIIFLVRGFTALSPSAMVVAFAAGVFYILMNVFYFQAAKIEEISRIIPLFYLSPLFTSLLAAIFLKEILTPPKYGGVFLLIVGAVLISSRNFSRPQPGKAFWLMVLAAVSSSLDGVITKHLLSLADFWTVFAYTRIGIIFPLLPILYRYTPELVGTVKRCGVKLVGIMSINESLNVFAFLLSTAAAAIGYISLVSALSSIHPFFVLLFTVILGLYRPEILKEELGRSVILTKVVAITIMFAGVLLVI